MSVGIRAATLVDTLRERADAGDGGGYRFVTAAQADPAMLSFRDLEQRARDVAAELSLIAPPGARAVLIYPPGLDFLVAFFGAMCAGVAPVPVYPPSGGDLQRSLSRLEHVVADARPEAVLTTSLLQAARDSAGLAIGPASLRWLATDQLRTGSGDGWVPPRMAADDVALVQYTSGSTAAPKGVVVRHRQLLANLEAIRDTMAVGPDSVAVGWVPPYHDMGLVGFILEALYAGFSSFLLGPRDFLQRPVLWLETISRYGGVVSGGPNFGFELCTRRITEAEAANLDLSSWQRAFSGAERVRADALLRFCKRFGPYGFDPKALYPCYGLAEASLFVSGSRPGAGIRTLSIDRGGLEDGQVRPARPGAPEAAEVTSCGRTPAGHRVVIADPDTGGLAGPDTVGEVWFAGPSVASGYLGRPAESADVFAATLADAAEPFLRTGDLGFLRDGELYLTGRRKDLLVVYGRNIYPTDVEDAAQSVARSLRPGCGASFLIAGDSTDLVIVQETSEDDPQELRKLALAVRKAVADALNVTAADVVLVRPRTVPKTSSGKLRRSACRQDYLAGRLDPVFQLGAGPPAPIRAKDGE